MDLKRNKNKIWKIYKNFKVLIVNCVNRPKPFDNHVYVLWHSESLLYMMRMKFVCMTCRCEYTYAPSHIDMIRIYKCILWLFCLRLNFFFFHLIVCCVQLKWIVIKWYANDNNNNKNELKTGKNKSLRAIYHIEYIHADTQAHIRRKKFTEQQQSSDFVELGSNGAGWSEKKSRTISKRSQHLNNIEPTIIQCFYKIVEHLNLRVIKKISFKEEEKNSATLNASTLFQTKASNERRRAHWTRKKKKKRKSPGRILINDTHGTGKMKWQIWNMPINYENLFRSLALSLS